MKLDDEILLVKYIAMISQLQGTDFLGNTERLKHLSSVADSHYDPKTGTYRFLDDTLSEEEVDAIVQQMLQDTGIDLETLCRFAVRGRFDSEVQRRAWFFIVSLGRGSNEPGK